MTQGTESLVAARSDGLREAAQELMNATEGYDLNVKQVIKAVDALRGAADEIAQLRAEVSDLKKRLGYPEFAR